MKCEPKKAMLKTIPDDFSIMGILNVTPDSFSDAGKYFGDTAEIIDRAAQMIEEGAKIIDIGAESTRPASQEISIDEELNRIMPAVIELRKRFDVIISADTRKSQVAAQVLRAGANWINDVSAGRFDEKMPEIVAETGAKAVLVHSRGTPQTMQESPHYDDVIFEVKSELQAAALAFVSAGVAGENIILDPGIGFAKRYEDNIKLTANLNEIAFDGYPILYAASRKRFIAEAIGSDARERVSGGLAAVFSAYVCGASIFRVHDVRQTHDFLKMAKELKKNAVSPHFLPNACRRNYF